MHTELELNFMNWLQVLGVAIMVISQMNQLFCHSFQYNNNCFMFPNIYFSFVQKMV